LLFCSVYRARWSAATFSPPRFENRAIFGLQRTNYSRVLRSAEWVRGHSFAAPSLVLHMSMHYHSPFATISGPIHESNDH
jgi:hypothetical protein